MYRTAPATCGYRRSWSSVTIDPSDWGTPALIRTAMSVSALPISIWPQATSYFRPSRAAGLSEPGDRVLGRGIGRSQIRSAARMPRGTRC